MRRQTNTINYSAQLPLAQGVKFDFLGGVVPGLTRDFFVS